MYARLLDGHIPLWAAKLGIVMMVRHAAELNKLLACPELGGRTMLTSLYGPKSLSQLCPKTLDHLHNCMSRFGWEGALRGIQFLANVIISLSP